MVSTCALYQGELFSSRCTTLVKAGSSRATRSCSTGWLQQLSIFVHPPASTIDQVCLFTRDDQACSHTPSQVHHIGWPEAGMQAASTTEAQSQQRDQSQHRS